MATTELQSEASHTSRGFEYHLRQAYHAAERDEVHYHIRKAAASLDQ
ncbi:hypothetical protein [Halogranum rubrum]|nr:hypothetical protein [Halogranum rubrum]